MPQRVRKVVLAYSGGLDTSIIVSWLLQNYGCEVISDTGDVGQAGELDGLEAKARQLGLPRGFCLTRRQHFFARLGFTVVPRENLPAQDLERLPIVPAPVVLRRGCHAAPRAARCAPAAAAWEARS